VLPELTIIIVNWNGGNLIRNCLRSISQSPPSVAYDIVVVDNASSDDSVAWLRSEEVSRLMQGTVVHVIENSDNAGFSKANNQAIASSCASMLFLLNPDTEVTTGAIDTLIACLNSNERIGACGPRLLNTDGSLQPSVYRNPPTAWAIVITGIGLWRLIPRRLRGELLLGDHWDHASRRAVPLLFGAAILAKRAMIEDVGGLDERFHMYGEDYEWCLRIARAGWELIFEPAASVIHHHGKLSQQRWSSSEKLRVRMNAGFQYNRYCLSRRHSIANLLATCLVSFLQKNWYRLRGRPVEAAQIMWELHLADLKRTLSGR
jgi:N-acetylglucosaminyl-diphospho-decaprenol L-rhamnosyltransferase